MLRHGPLHAFLEDSGRMEIVIQNLPAESKVLQKYKPYQIEYDATGMRFIVPAGIQRELIEQTWAAGGTLKSVTPLRRTLEDLFMKWTK